MAFGSAVGGGRDRLAAVLKIRADTGQAKTEITQLGREVESVMKGMTAEQIKLDRATRHFQDTLKRYGAEHERTKSAAIRLSAAEKQLAASMRQSEHQARQNQHVFDGTLRSMSRMTRGAIAGSGVFQALGRTMAFASAGFIGTTGFVYGVKRAISAASDLDEQMNKTKEVFGSTAGQVVAFSNNALGLSRRQALETSSTIGALLHAMGMLGPEATKNAVALTRLGVDLSSFYNTTVEDALAAIQSALVGQVRPLRRYGAEVSAAREKTVALAMTGKTSAAELTRQERVMARLAIIFKDTTVAQGDYARTQHGLANEQRSLSANIEDMAAVIGHELIPASEDLLDRLNKWLGSTENQKRVQKDVNKFVKDAGSLIRGFSGALQDAKAILDPFVTAVGGLGNAIELVFGVALAIKIRRWMTGMGMIGSSTTAAAATVVSEATVMEEALDAATRPRTVVVTTEMVGGGVPGAPGTPGTPGGTVPVPIPPGKKGFLGKLGKFGKRFGKFGAYAVGAAGVVEGLAGQATYFFVIGGGGVEETKPVGVTYEDGHWYLEYRWGHMETDEDTIRKNFPDAYRKYQAAVMAGRLKSKSMFVPKPKPGDRTDDPNINAAARRRRARINKAQTAIGGLQVKAEIAQRNKTLNDDIQIAKQIAAQFKIIADNTRGSAKVVNAARLDYEQALGTVYNLEVQQDEDAKAKAAARAAERKRREAARKAREKEQARAYRAMLAARETRLETAVDKATTLKGLRKARANLIDFLKAEIKDRKLTDKERARYEAMLQKAVAGGVEDELKLREQTLKTRLTRAKLTDDKNKDDIQAEKNLIAFYAAAAKRAGQTVKEVKTWLDKKAKAQVALKALLKKSKDAESRTQGQLALDFLQTRSDFFSQFGPNVFTKQGTGAGSFLVPGAGNASTTTSPTVIVNQNYTSSPEDQFRAAKMARFAMDASFDG